MQIERSKTLSRSRSREFEGNCMQMSMRIFHPWFKVLRNPLFRTSRLRIQPTEQNLGLGYFVGQIRLHENCLQIF